MTTLVDEQMTPDELLQSIFDELDGYHKGVWTAGRIDITKGRIRTLAYKIRDSR